MRRRVVEDDDRVDAALHEGAERGLAALQGAGEPVLALPQGDLEGHEGEQAAGGDDDAVRGAQPRTARPPAR